MDAGNKTLTDKNALKTFAAIVLAALIVLIVTPLFQAGSFIDANLYKTVAANFSEAGTSFWNMKFTNTSMSFFCEQPPLYMFLLSLFYRLFGLHFLSDRFFTLLHLILFLVVLYGICKKLFAERKNFYFLLNLLFLLSIQVLCWTFSQQVIESLVLVLAALTLYIYLLYLETSRIFLIILFSMTVFLLFLSKGFQSCFVLLLPIVHALSSRFERNKVRFAFWSVSLSVLSIGFLLFYYPPAVKWFDCYFKARLVLTMNDVGATTVNHFALLFEALLQNILLLVVFATMLAWLRIKKLWQSADKKQNEFGFALLFTALGGILPFMLSLVQRAFYPVPAYLFLVLYFTYMFRENWSLLWDRVCVSIGNRWIRTSVYVILLLSFSYFIFLVPQHKREQALEEDIDKISAFFSIGDTVRISPELWNNFNLHALLYMKKKVSLSPESSSKGYLLWPQGKSPANQNDTYHKIALQTLELQLYRIPD